MSKITIQGTVRYQQLGTGFWGIIGEDGREWRPVNMPEQIKKEGAKVRITARPAEEDMSIFMWGEAVRVTGFHTL